MRVIIDLQAAQSGSRTRGIGRYALGLTEALLTNYPEEEFIIVLNGSFPYQAEEVRYHFRDLIPQLNIKTFDLPYDFLRREERQKTFEAEEIIRERFIAELHPDIVLVAGGLMDGGIWEPVVSSAARLTKTAPVASVFYDLIPMTDVENYLPQEWDRELYFRRLEQTRNADLLLSISKFSASDVKRFLPDYKGDLVALPEAIDPKFKPAERDYDFSDFLCRLSITKPFLLFASSFDPRKNQKGLIRSFSMLPEEVRKSHQLVLVGGGGSAVYQHYAEFAEECGLPKDLVVFPGGVSDQDLIDLYRSCKLFVFPSFYEGIGLPYLEAMACNAPAIASNTTSLGDLLPEPEAGFNPESDKELSEKIEELLVNDAKRERLRSIGFKWVQKYTWKACADTAMDALRATEEKFRRNHKARDVQSIEVFREAIDNISTFGFSEIRNKEIAYCLTKNEIEAGERWSTERPRKVAWVTTWGKRCGIATYSEHLYESLTEKPLILCQKNPAPNNHTKNCIPCWSLWEPNSPNALHELEDAIIKENCTEVLIQFNYYFFDFYSLSRLIHRLRDRGIAVFMTFHSTVNPPNDSGRKLFLLFPALLRLNGIFVHSIFDLHRLKDLGLTENIKIFPHGICNYKVNDTPFETSDKRRIATYGFFLPRKGLQEVIEAVKILKDSNYPVYLTMVNACYDDSAGVSRDFIEECKAKVVNLGLTDQIEMITDFLDDNESIQHLRQSELILFAYPSTATDSASGAVRGGLSSGRPVAVTPVSMFADVRRVTIELPGTSPADLAKGIKTTLEDLKNNSTTIRVTQQRAHRFCEVLDYTNIAQYMDYCMKKLSVTPKPAEIGISRKLCVDISSLVRHDDRTGIQRMVRSILHSLVLSPPANWKIIPVYLSHDGNGYRHAKNYMSSSFGLQYSTPDEDLIEPEAGEIFLGLDFTMDLLDKYAPVIQRYRSNDVVIVYVLCDILCLTHPENFEPHVIQYFKRWFNFVVHNSKAIACISKTVMNEVQSWIHKFLPGVTIPTLGWFHLGADMEHSMPTSGFPENAKEIVSHLNARITFTTVGRVESRKCQAQMYFAFEMLWAKGIDVNLVIVGSQGWDAEGIISRIRENPELGTRLFWLEGISDEFLGVVYDSSDAFVSASIGEGFGLPIVEAAKHSIPIIARDIPIFREVGGDHMFYFRGRQPKDLADAIEEWLFLYADHSHPKSTEMPYQTWAQSAQQLINFTIN